MFLRQIDEFEAFFKWLDRLNLLAYNVWRDRQADAYKTGSMHQIETLYRTYISDMRQISNELLLLQKQIEEEKEEIYRLQREISELKLQPSIEGCQSAYFEDEHGNQISGIFAVSWNDYCKMDGKKGFHHIDRL